MPFSCSVFFHFQNEYVVIWKSTYKTLPSFQILGTTEHKIFLFEHALLCIELNIKNVKQSGKCVKREAFTSLKCNFELKKVILDISVHFLAICYNVEEKKLINKTNKQTNKQKTIIIKMKIKKKKK